jgi:hypothetical protein
MTINWQKIAEQNGLAPDEFSKEIFTVACAVAAMKIDSQNHDGVLKFTCSDDVGQLEMYVRRADHIKKES